MLLTPLKETVKVPDVDVLSDTKSFKQINSSAELAPPRLLYSTAYRAVIVDAGQAARQAVEQMLFRVWASNPDASIDQMLRYCTYALNPRS